MKGYQISEQYVNTWLNLVTVRGQQIDEFPKSALRLIKIPASKVSDSDNGNEKTYIKRKANFFYRPKRILPAPRILERVRQTFGWPTPNTLVRRYFPKYPHTSWWEKAYSRMIQHARVPNIKYLLKCLQTIKEEVSGAQWRYRRSYPQKGRVIHKLSTIPAGVVNRPPSIGEGGGPLYERLSWAEEILGLP